MYCHDCRRLIYPGFKSCPPCTLRMVNMDADLGDASTLTRMSMGRYRLARNFGNIFFVASFVFVVIAVLRAFAYGHFSDDPVATVAIAFFLLFCAYEVWAFTHGRSTSIDSYRHEATPDRTGWRVFGLVLDLAFWCLCVWLLKSW